MKRVVRRTYSAFSLVHLGGHATGAAQTGFLLLLPVVGGALKDSSNINDTLSSHLLGRHDLVGLGEKQILWKTSIIIDADEVVVVIDDGELNINDGLDTQTIFDLGGNVLLEFLLEDVRLDVEAVGSGGFAEAATNKLRAASVRIWAAVVGCIFFFCSFS